MLSIVAGVVLLAVLTGVSAGVLGLVWLANLSPHLQFILLLAAIALIVYGLAGGGRLSLKQMALRPLDIPYSLLP